MAPENPQRVQKARRFAWLLDNSIRLPGGFRIGIEAILGLVPGIGDAAGLVLALYVPWVAWRSHASVPTLLHMTANIAIEALVGAVPVIGDLFDFAWKANTRNVALLDSHLEQPQIRQRRDLVYVLLVPLLLIGLFGLILFLVFAVAAAVWRLLAG